MSRCVGIIVTGACLFAAMLIIVSCNKVVSTPTETVSVVEEKPAVTRTPSADEPDDGLFEYAGQVLDPDGKPVEGATVEIYEQLFWDFQVSREIGKIRTDANGGFGIKGRPESFKNCISIVCYKDGYGVFAQYISPLQGAYCPITLDQSVVLAGTVIDENDKPIAGAIVGSISSMEGELNILAIEGYIPSIVAKTDTDGRFRLDNLPPDYPVTRICVKAKGYVTAIVEEGSRDACDSTFEFDNENVRLRMHRESVIRGRLVEKRTNNPVGGVAIEVFDKSGEAVRMMPPVVSGEDGGFCIEGLDAGIYCLGAARRPHLSMKWAIEDKNITIASGQIIEDVRLKAVKCGIAEFKITDENDKPVPDFLVYIKCSRPLCKHDSILCGISNDDGILKIPALPGSYEICQLSDYDLVMSDHFYPGGRGAFLLSEGKTFPIKVQHRDDPYFKMLEGTVVDSDGAPVPGVVVTPVQMKLDYPFITDRKGGFRIPLYMYDFVDEYPSGGPKLGLFVAECFYKNLAGAAVVDVEKESHVKIVLTKGAAITGQVVTSDGKPLPRGEITVYPVLYGDTCYYLEREVVIDNGEYSVDCLAGGVTYELCISSPDYGLAFTSIYIPRTVEKPVTVDKVTLLPADKCISGVVVDENGSPISSAGVDIWQTKEQYGLSDRVDKDGKFKAVGLIAGKVNVEVSAIGYETKNVIVDAGDTNVEIILEETKPDFHSDDEKPIEGGEDF